MSSNTLHSPLAVICIPSFRRPQGLKLALESLNRQIVDFPYAVVVVDNDARDQGAMETAERFFQDNAMAGHVVLETEQGNVFAINRAFAKARSLYPDASYFLMMDDDEEATETWLAAMVSAAQRYNADIVGGPVRRRFEVSAHAGISRHPLFLSIEGNSGVIEQIHGSGNCLLTRRVFETLDQPQFDTRFNLLGGGDMDFFTRCRNKGLVTAWAGEALIYEDVPQSRMKSKWIMARSLRTGIINYNIDRSRRSGLKGLVLLGAKNLISLGLSVPRSLAILMKTGHWLPASHPILMSLGRILASVGIMLTPYKAKSITGQSQ